MKPGLYSFERGLSTTRTGYAYVIEASRVPGKVRARVWNNRRRRWFKPITIFATALWPAEPTSAAARAAFASIARGEHRA